MSVIKSKRKQSETQFLQNARELHVHTFRKCSHFPVRYRRYAERHILSKTAKIMDCVNGANRIYPLTKSEAQMRRELFLTAQAEIAELVKQIEFLSEVIGIEKTAHAEWIALIDDEDRLIRGILKKDRERYKTLPD